MRIHLLGPLSISVAALVACDPQDPSSAPAAKQANAEEVATNDADAPASGPSETQEPAPAEPLSCQEQAEAMGERLLGLCAQGVHGPVNLPGPGAPEGLEMPWHHYPTLRIEVRAQDCSYEGEALPDFDALHDKWDDDSPMAPYRWETQKGYSDAPIRWSLSAAPDIPAARTLELLTSFEAEAFVDGAFVFRGAAIEAIDAPDPDYAQQLVELQNATKGERRSEVYAAEAKRIIGLCLPVMEAFMVVAGVEPDQRCEVLARESAKGLTTCGCTMDGAKLETFIMGLAQEKPAEYWSIPVYVRLSMAGEWIEYEPGETWGELLAKVDWAAVDDPVVPHAIWFEAASEDLSPERADTLGASCKDDGDTEACAALCRKQDPDGCDGWARALDGAGAGRDWHRAKELQLRSARIREGRCNELQDAHECLTVADRYAYGTTSDREQAKKLRLLACEYGLNTPCRELAKALEKRGGASLIRAGELYDIACARDDETACTDKVRVEELLSPDADETG